MRARRARPRGHRPKPGAGQAHVPGPSTDHDRSREPDRGPAGDGRAMDKRVKRAVFGLMTGTTAGCTLSLVYYLMRRRIRDKRARKRYEADTATVNSGNTCVLCGGTATVQTLTEILGQPVYRCTDRKLC